MNCIFMIGVQPTSYNHYFFSKLKNEYGVNFNFYYTEKYVKNLNFKALDEGNYLSYKKILSFFFLANLFSKKTIFVISGWNNPKRFIIIFLRLLFNRHFVIWTDSINPSAFKKNNLIFLIKRIILKRATIILTTGNFGVNKMKKIIHNNCFKIWNLPFIVPIANKPISLTKKNDKINFLITSRLVEGKGLMESLQLFKKIKNFGLDNYCLYIAGEGELKSKIMKFISNEKINAVVLGWLDENELNEVRKNTDFLIHLVTVHDPFPVSVIESLANGIPVIGSNLAGSVSDRVINGFNGFKFEMKKDDNEIFEILKSILNYEINIYELKLNSLKSSKKWDIDFGIKIFQKFYEISN